MDKSEKDSHRKLKGIVSLSALLVALVHILWPDLKIDAITLVLVIIAILPWLAPLIKSVELPGGFKIELQEFQKAAAQAESAGLLAPASAVISAPAEFTFQTVAQQDPNLALAGLRIEIDKRLQMLATVHGIETRNRGVGQLLRLLAEKQVLDYEERSALADMVGLLNSAVHGATVDPRATEWAMQIGPRLLKGLDTKIDSKSGG